ncbi:trimethylamine N-oxide reductase system protein TorE [Shewanella sp. Choline-02u-19]|jgi:nitrate reductase NapE|uniref:trimethylamine N-oxide reductase system protein TorE n=1 Tax=unclassified Shewanella TaxID=196818 RepID=UPI000C320F9B|nr:MULTISPECIES: trimethylamine N-oxide reductase system protein TorE [unclassified Shewanella]PKG58543.1 trimethylamine N-oxide reductase system protein TorE [Shewanella sp. GutDb-MelDb]PKG75978.1 trimethylamine N-oxide reductase system protein TorE [Shewanella sp. GutCb]PKH56741.1 trimethylamine N-oxide reductase system protein TorE [Shewanella sp. Bg11-22]PKI30292.1 trimethylamine N-oxide reductase system protein TorE [Shewanella sp. Choline-02u-19]
MTNQNPTKKYTSNKKDELKALFFIIFILFPALSIAFVSTYGFIIWMIQAFGGVVAH